MKSHKKIRKGMHIVLAVVFAVLALLLFFPLPQNIAEAEAEPKETELTIRCVGDIMGHLSQLIANYDSSTGTYDFSGDYAYVSEYIKEADLALCNVETTFLGDGNYKGYPYFNSPDQMAFDIAGAGFDVALFANNHILDTNMAGLDRSLTVLREAGLETVGARKEGERQTLVVSVSGVKIGIVAYTYETGLYNGHRTLNGSIMPEGAENFINSFRYYEIEEDLKAIASDIQDVKNNGAEIVVAYFHWGEEYQRNYSAIQRDIAEASAEAGADIIFASHPHVLQGIEEFVTEYQVPLPEHVEEPVQETSWIIKLRSAFGLIPAEPEEEPNADIPQIKTRVVPVFYSMGNFISNQRQETLDNRYTEQGMIASVHLTYVADTKEIKNIVAEFIPTWVEKYKKDGQTEYAIIPLVGDFRENPDLKNSGHINRAEEALTDMIELIGGKYLYQYEYGAE